MLKMRSREVCRAERAAARAAREAQIDAGDREAADRLARVTLGPVIYPQFTQACPDGTCARCHGHQFRRTHSGPGAATTAAMFGPVAGILTAVTPGDLAECITCGARYETA